MIKYIVALLALQPEIYENEAQKSFVGTIDEYVAGPESYPHITLCQFYADEKIIEKIDNDLSSIKNFPRPYFNGLHFVKDPLPNLWGAEISISREPKLVDFHKQIVQILQKYGINSYITGVDDLFRPHLTLARINKLQITHFNENLLNNSTFALTIGKASEIGQYKKVLKIYPAVMEN